MDTQIRIHRVAVEQIREDRLDCPIASRPHPIPASHPHPLPSSSSPILLLPSSPTDEAPGLPSDQNPADGGGDSCPSRSKVPRTPGTECTATGEEVARTRRQRQQRRLPAAIATRAWTDHDCTGRKRLRLLRHQSDPWHDCFPHSLVPLQPLLLRNRFLCSI